MLWLHGMHKSDYYIVRISRLWLCRCFSCGPLIWLKYSHFCCLTVVTIKWKTRFKLKCMRSVTRLNISQHVHTGIRLYVFIRALFQVISELGIYLICWTKINAAGLAIVPQLGFNRPRWNRIDLWRNQNRNRNGACQVWILGAGLGWGKPSERTLITFRWPESRPSDDGVYSMCISLQVCPSVYFS